jgi:hypothetical protein
VASGCVLAACDRDDGGSSARFCEQVGANQAALFEPMSVVTRVDAEALIDLWERVGGDAPLAIEADWDAYVLSLETALAADEQEVLARAYATEQSGIAIAGWLATNCGITIPVATIVPAGGPPVGSGEATATT